MAVSTVDTPLYLTIGHVSKLCSTSTYRTVSDIFTNNYLYLSLSLSFRVSSSFALAGTQNGVLLLHCLLTLLPTSSLTKPLLTALVQKCSSDDELSLIK